MALLPELPVSVLAYWVPMALMFATLERVLGPRVAALDYLVALGTHMPMSVTAINVTTWRIFVFLFCLNVKFLFAKNSQRNQIF